MKKKIIKLSILAVTLCAVLFTTFVPALADSREDYAHYPLFSRFSVLEGDLDSFNIGLQSVHATTNNDAYVIIGVPDDFSLREGAYMSFSVFDSANTLPYAFYIKSKLIFMVLDSQLLVPSVSDEYIPFTDSSVMFEIYYIPYVDMMYLFFTCGDGVIYFEIDVGSLPNESDCISEAYFMVFSSPYYSAVGDLFTCDNFLYTEMPTMTTYTATIGYMVSVAPDQFFGEAYQQGFEEGGALGYEEGYADGLADGSASGGGNTDGSYDEGYAAGKTDGFDEGYAQGMTEGQVIGQDIGYTAGLNAGKEMGYADGKADGLADVEQKEEAAYNNGFTAGKTEGKAEGYTDGKADGLADLETQKNASYNQGFDAGEDQGYSEGYEDGYDVGRQEGIETGAQTGYDSGYFAGYEKGEEVGYSNGHADGIQYAIDQRKDAWIETGYEMGFEDGEKSGLADLDEKCDQAYGEGFADGEVTGWDDGYLAGESVGISKGKLIGHDEGYALGYNKGDVDGYNRGIEQTNFLFDAVNGTWHGVVEAYSTLADGITLFNVSLGEVVATAGLFMLITFIVKAVRGA